MSDTWEQALNMLHASRERSAPGRQGARGSSLLLWGSRGERVLWGPFGAKSFVFGAKGSMSAAHMMPALFTGRTGGASRSQGQVCPQGRVFTGLVLGGGGGVRWKQGKTDMTCCAAQPWDHPASTAGSTDPERESC